MKLVSKDISEVSKLSGVPASTLRYYEEKGLIRSTGRKGMRRLFDDNVIDQLNFIALGRLAGFSLDETAPMITKGGSYQVDRALLLEKAAEIEVKIKELMTVHKGLLHAADCPAPSHSECPTFQRLLKQAGIHTAHVKANRNAT